MDSIQGESSNLQFGIIRRYFVYTSSLPFCYYVPQRHKCVRNPTRTCKSGDQIQLRGHLHNVRGSRYNYHVPQYMDRKTDISFHKNKKGHDHA